jgi:DNA-binding CsgD family transcriptional regulator
LFTSREVEILKWAIERLTNQEIADLLCISEKTVKRHKQNVMLKANLKGKKEFQVFLNKLCKLVLQVP